MSESAPPTYVYKIVPTSPPSPLPRELPLSELDRKDGFIHMSTAAQVPGTLNRFFKDVQSLWILRIPFSKTVSRTKWENGFPHLYGNFGVEEVDSAEEFAREESGEEEWDAVVERKAKAGWLV